MEMEMDAEREREREMAAGRRSDHEGRAEEVAKRRKIVPDGVAELLRRLQGEQDDAGDEKMEVDASFRGEREVVKEGDHKWQEEGEAEERQQRAAVVFADRRRTVEKKEENGKWEAECEVATMVSDAEWQSTEGKGHVPDSIQMEVEEAAKNLQHKTGGGEDVKIDPAAEERKRRLKEYEEWRKRKEEERVDPDPELLTDYNAYQAKSFEQMWNKLYANKFYGSFHDEIECLVNQLILHRRIKLS